MKAEFPSLMNTWKELRKFFSDKPTSEAFKVIFIFQHSNDRLVTDESLSFTPESLNVKKRMLDIELKNTKQKLAPKLKKKFQEISDEKFATVFQIDKAIIELGKDNFLDASPFLTTT